MATRTIELERSDLDKSIEVLSSAARALQLTRFERLSYRALTVSVDVAAVTFIAFSLLQIIIVATNLNPKNLLVMLLTTAINIIFDVCIFAGIVLLALNTPLFLKAFRESTRLKELGLSSLSKSLWMESQRKKGRTDLVRQVLLFIFLLNAVPGLLIELFSILTSGVAIGDSPGILSLMVAVILIGVLLGTQYLRNQRERLALTADAEELRKALQSLRDRDVEVVTVPSELVEETAKIEAAQIAKERKDAVLRSIASPSREYAVAFDRSAVEQRATLSIAERLELENFVEQVSAEAAEPESQAGEVVGYKDATLRGATKSKRVEIDYAIDRTSRRIRINAVRLRDGGSGTSTNGAGHA